ncbi:MAG TPA: transporter, partial [Caldimonas sp.]|nr:transporter [Caldimonas sp.]
MTLRPPSTTTARAAMAAIGATLALALPSRAADGDEPRTNVFNDPFVQATHAIAACPVAEGPLVTAA